MSGAEEGAGVERVRELPWPLVVVAGGVAAEALNWTGAHGGLMLATLGTSLALCGWRQRRHRWLWEAELPLLAIGVVVASAAALPFVSDHLTNVLFVVLGISLVVVDIGGVGRAWGATFAMVAVTLGFVAQAAGSRSSLLPGWTFGAVVAGLGAVLLASDIARPGADIPATLAAPPLPLRPSPCRLMMIRGAILFAGAIGVSLVDRLNQNLYEVVLALGVAYLIPGVITGHRRWAESGVLLTTVGAAIVSTDLFVAAPTYIYALVFGSIALALLILQTFSLGSVAGVGRSLITVGLALWVLATLPHILPWGGAWASVDALFPLLPGTSGLVLLIGGWVRYEREAARSGRVDP